MRKMLNTLKKIAFERVGGTDSERKVFDILIDEVRTRGLEPHLEPFEISTFHRGEGNVVLESESPLKFAVNPIGLSGNADITANFRYIEPSNLPLADSCEGQIIILPERVSFRHYEHLARIGASAFIVVNPPGHKPGFQSLKSNFVDCYGKIPGAVIGYEAGLKLISNNKHKLHLQCQQEEFLGISHNLLVTIKGQKNDGEIFVCAHADSVAGSPGAVDNGAGCVEMLGIMGHFAKQPPKRTIHFCFFGSEELGLMGSQFYVKKHIDELNKIAIVFNLDVGGDIFGDNKAIITGDQNLANFIDSHNKLRGMGLRVTRSIYSSDNMPFARHGIPSVNFVRSGLGASLGHSSDDDLRNVDERSLRSLAEIALDYIISVANGIALPFERTIPNDIADEVEKYFIERFGLEK
ncbi:Zn-dependent exopeptidase M28 [bacterium]|nr:Zn-dependent exopeptidase M28 [bacterium]